MNQILTKSLITFSFLLFFYSCNNSEKNKKPISNDQPEPVPQNEIQKSIVHGKSIYNEFCIQCHLTNGKGVPNNFPPLDGSNWLTEKREESIRSVKFGQSGEIEVNEIKYNGTMIPMGLSNKEIADVLNYVMNSWSNTQEKMVTKQEVSNVEK